MKLSENFSLWELTKSQTAERKGISNVPGEEEIKNLTALCRNVLQVVRANYRVPINPSSGYRCLALNNANWVPEIEAHLPPRIEREIVLWNPNLSQKRRDELNELHVKSSALKFLLMNVEAFSSQKGVDVAKLFVARFKTFMVIDESTTIKNRRAKRTKALCAVGRDAVYRRILTGSPVTRSPLDLFSQMAFLDPGSLLSSPDKNALKVWRSTRPTAGTPPPD